MAGIGIGLTTAQRTLQGHIRTFTRDFPGGGEVRDLFRGARSEPVYARRALIPDAPPGSWFLLVRLDQALEERFGLTREFVVYCSRATDLQTRALNQISWLIQNAPRPIDRDHAIIVIADQDAEAKVRDWAVEQNHRFLLAPIVPAALREAMAKKPRRQLLTDLLEKWWFARNLYEERTPVTGPNFFGRRVEVQKLTRTITGGKHAGVFGLRKIGKTSLLWEVRDSLRDQGEVLTSVVDLQASGAHRSGGHVAFRLGRELAVEANRATLIPAPVVREAVGAPKRYDADRPLETIAALGDGLYELLNDNPSLRIALIMDEAEMLFSREGTLVAHARELLQTLRAVAQQTSRCSLVLAGVNATPCERPVIGGEDNPIFALLDMQYLGPLDTVACTEMVRLVGRKMGLKWAPSVARVLVDCIGGHPLLARLAASDVATQCSTRPCEVPLSTVDDVMQDFHLQHHAELTEMLESLRRYYPAELELLHLAAEAQGEDKLTEWREAYPDAITHLSGYGVLDPGRLSIRIPPLVQLLRG